jgi:serine phosphatase RsbU (regulator of sigma subunit)/PAS domain-containing protein
MADLQAAGSSATAHTATLLEALFENAAVGMAAWDRELRFERVNGELAAMNGVPVAQHLGRRPAELLPELGPQLETTLRQVLASGEAVRNLEIEGETPAAPGATRHWVADYFPVRDERGEIAGVAGLVVEVTGERHADVRAAEARRHSAFIDAELRALYSALPVGVAFLSPDLRYQRVNETLARMNGRSVAAHQGATLQEVLGEPAAGLAQALEQVMETRETLELELSVPMGDDPSDVRAFEATYFPVVSSGRLLGVGGVVRDVTERRDIALEQSRLLREALVARADAEAAQVRTDDAREEAERTGMAAERARARMTVLAEAGRRMAQSMDSEATLVTVVRSAVPAVADWASLTMVEPSGQLRIHAVAHSDPERERLAGELMDRYPPDRGARVGVAQVIRTGEMEILADVSPDAIREVARDPEHLRFLQELNVRHIAIAPLRTPEGVIGALTFVLGDSGRRFEPEDQQLIASLAARAALHVQNARLYTERSAIARTLQTSLLPTALPAVPGAQVAGRYRAAGDQNTVGGDFYDLFQTGEAVWTAIVGDVSGKGAEAAAKTALARHTLRTASRLSEDPAANLALLNDALLEDGTSTTFCTVVYVRLCPAEDGFDLRFANGGHPPPLLVRTDGTVESVDSGRGPLVGALRTRAFEEGTLRLAPGELLLLYTDGVTEVRPSELELGERELRATLAAHAGASADEVVAAVERRAVELQNGRPRDDIALVAIRVEGRHDQNGSTVEA